MRLLDLTGDGFCRADASAGGAAFALLGIDAVFAFNLLLRCSCGLGRFCFWLSFCLCLLFCSFLSYGAELALFNAGSATETLVLVYLMRHFYGTCDSIGRTYSGAGSTTLALILVYLTFAA